jgi:hypothetical protein
MIARFKCLLPASQAVLVVHRKAAAGKENAQQNARYSVIYHCG